MTHNFGINTGAMATAMARSHYRPRNNPVFGDDHLDLMFYNMVSLGIRRALDDEVTNTGRFSTYAESILNPIDGQVFLTGIGNELVKNVFRVVWYQTMLVYTTQASTTSILQEGGVPQVQIIPRQIPEWFTMAADAARQQMAQFWKEDPVEERPSFVAAVEFELDVSAKFFIDLLKEAYQYDHNFKFNIQGEHTFRVERGAAADAMCQTLSVESVSQIMPEVIAMPIGETDNMYRDVREASDAAYIDEQSSLEQAARARRVLDAQNQTHLYPEDHFRLENPVAAAQVAASTEELQQHELGVVDMTEEEFDALQEDAHVVGLDPDYDVAEASAEEKQQAFEAWLESEAGINYQVALLRGDDVLPPTFDNPTHASEIVEVANGPIIHVPCIQVLPEPAHLVIPEIPRPVPAVPASHGTVRVQMVDDITYQTQLTGGVGLEMHKKALPLCAVEKDPGVLDGSFGKPQDVAPAALDEAIAEAAATIAQIEQIETITPLTNTGLPAIVSPYFQSAMKRVTGK